MVFLSSWFPDISSVKVELFKSTGFHYAYKQLTDGIGCSDNGMCPTTSSLACLPAGAGYAVQGSGA